MNKLAYLLNLNLLKFYNGQSNKKKSVLNWTKKIFSINKKNSHILILHNYKKQNLKNVQIIKEIKSTTQSRNIYLYKTIKSYTIDWY